MLLEIDFLSIDPQLLEFIKCPCRFLEYMGDHISVVHQDPVTVTKPFHSDGSDPFFLERLFDVFLYRFDLCRALTGADNKIVCYSAQAP